MSERYFVTGVQLGLLIALPNQEERQKLVDEIIDKQFLGDKESFEKKFKPTKEDILAREEAIERERIIDKEQDPPYEQYVEEEK
jgi:hypothetical protein